MIDDAWANFKQNFSEVAILALSVVPCWHFVALCWVGAVLEAVVPGTVSRAVHSLCCLPCSDICCCWNRGC